MHVCVFTQPLGLSRKRHQLIFKLSLTGLNSEFFLLVGWLLYQGERAQSALILRIAWGKIVGFIHFPLVLAHRLMRGAFTRSWTRITVSIYNNGKHYTIISVCECVFFCRCVKRKKMSYPNKLNGTLRKRWKNLPITWTYVICSFWKKVQILMINNVKTNIPCNLLLQTHTRIYMSKQ